VTNKLRQFGPLLLVLLIVFSSLLFKSSRINDPYFGPHISRQLQNMATIEFYIRDGIDFFKPRSNYRGWPGYNVFEGPVYQSVIAWLARFMGEPLLVARIFNVIIGSLSALFVFSLTSKWFTKRIAILSVLFFIYSPLNLIFHQTVMTDILGVFFSLGALLGLVSYNQNKNIPQLLFFLTCGGIGGLIKPIFVLPCAVYYMYLIFDGRWHFNAKSIFENVKKLFWPTLCFIIITIIVILWIMQDTEKKVTSGVLKHLGWGSLVEPQFYIILVSRFFRQILNPMNVMFLILGCFTLKKIHRKNEAVVLLIIPISFYLLFPDVNKHHSYYSLMVVPYFSIIAACGLGWLWNKIEASFSQSQARAMIGLICLSSVIASIAMFVGNITTTMILPHQRYKTVEHEVKNILEPLSPSIVLLNKQAEYEPEEILRNRPRTYIKSFFKDMGEEEFKGDYYEHPFPRSAFLYAIRQYGWLMYKNHDLTFDLDEWK